jgi:hypothetical protein
VNSDLLVLNIFHTNLCVMSVTDSSWRMMRLVILNRKLKRFDTIIEGKLFSRSFLKRGITMLMSSDLASKGNWP